MSGQSGIESHETDAPSDHADGHEGHHGGSIKTYVAVFVALCLLTTASFFTYSEFWREHFSAGAGWAFMMAVSCTKALLVVLFFMHLLYEANWKYVLTIPMVFMSIFLVLMLVPDVGLRMNRVSEERRRHMALEPMPELQSLDGTSGDATDATSAHP
ncbi:MAG: hypothetical protein CMJ74_01220 [Planctomycetaceae bacterium]|nr:hypothetical protein [Planctomycetaceae bacterium]|tara:strand:+ start:403 stop:873 length:471 start_codon:yes stop_codon:yes gene_type:complete